MKTGKLLILILGFIIFSSIISAADSCSIVAESSCTSGNYKVLGLYASTNSHGYIISDGTQTNNNSNFVGNIIGNAIRLFTLNQQPASGNANTGGTPSGNYVLCCNFNPGSKICNNLDEVLSLSSSSNAHAEIPQLNTYATKVCYTNLQCTGVDSGTPNSGGGTTGMSIYTDYPIQMLSLSSITNAHLGGYNDYQWKILCKKITNTQSSILGSSTSSWTNGNSINLTSSQLGTSAAKVQIIVNNINAPINTPVYFEIYERDTYTGTGGSSNVPITGNFFKSLGNAIRIFNFNFGSPSSPLANNSNYIYVPIRTGVNNITGSVGANGQSTIDWIITQSDINKAILGDADNNYEFTYKVIVGSESKSFYENILNVNMPSLINNTLNLIEKWLDGNKITVITSKSMDWNSLIVSGGGGTGITGNAVGGNATNSYPSNLVYMNISNLPSTAIGKKVYFEIYESDAGQSTNDSIRVGSSAINVDADSTGKAVAAWYVLQVDINKAIPNDPINSQGVGNFEFYYKARYWNGMTYVYAPINNYLNLQIYNYPVNITPTNYLLNADGIWTDENFTVGITSFDYNQSLVNTVGMAVEGISPLAAGQTLYFEIYGINGVDGTHVPIITDDSLSAVIAGDGTATETWTINPNDLQVPGDSPTNHKFFYYVKLGSEKKSFDHQILDVNVVSGNINITNGGECDYIYYCSDYETKNQCEDNPCTDVINNENALNPSLDCSNSSCYCFWSSGNCNFGYSNSQFNDLGICSYVKGEVQNNCDINGLLITPYTSVWNWNSENHYSTQSLCSANLSVGQSCVNSDGFWRIKDSSYDNCKDYQESVECSPSGGGLGGNGLPTNTKLKLLWILLIIGIVVLGFGVYLIIKRRMKEKMIKKLFKTKENFINILDYITKARQQKMPESDIRKNLLRAGWNSDQIEFAFKHAHKVKVK